MRKAALEADLVPDTTEGKQRVHFVTEGEASLYYCIDAGLAKSAIEVCICPYTADFLVLMRLTGQGLCYGD